MKQKNTCLPESLNFILQKIFFLILLSYCLKHRYLLEEENILNSEIKISLIYIICAVEVFTKLIDPSLKLYNEY